MTKLADPSRVVINAQLLSGSATYRSAGISTYINYLLSHLSLESHLDYHVFVGHNVSMDAVKLPFTRTKYATQHPLQRIIWEQTVLPVWLKYLHADLLHAPAFIGPVLSSCPQIITVHDLSFIRFPHFFKKQNRVYLKLLTGVSCRRAKAVIAVSHFTASEVHNLLRVPQNKIHTIYHGVDPRFQPLPEQDVTEFRIQMGLPERFILFLGTLEPRKNLKQLIRAYAMLRDKSVHLVLAGAQGWFYKELYELVDSLSMQNFVHFTGYIKGEHQVLWYNAAEVFAYLSTYEGFGLPVLEALACGIPTITSTSASLPEAGGDGALRVDPDNEEDIIEKLSILLKNDEIRKHLQQIGLEHAKKFSWQRTANATSRLYKAVLAQSKGVKYDF
jgi:glycosyltransferase involved in cell wall biosynthesis